MGISEKSPVYSGHHGGADPAATVTASATSTSFQVVAQFNNSSFAATAAIADNDIWAVGDSNPNTSNHSAARRALQRDELERRPHPHPQASLLLRRRGRCGQQRCVGRRVDGLAVVDRALGRHELERRLEPEAEAGGRADLR